jgi:hypothetical protein
LEHSSFFIDLSNNKMLSENAQLLNTYRFIQHSASCVIPVRQRLVGRRATLVFNTAECVRLVVLAILCSISEPLEDHKNVADFSLMGLFSSWSYFCRIEKTITVRPSAAPAEGDLFIDGAVRIGHRYKNEEGG